MHGAAGRGKAMLKKQLERGQVLAFGLPPIYHQDVQRIEAHVFIAGLKLLPACHAGAKAETSCGWPDPTEPVRYLRRRADVRCPYPTTDGRQIVLTRTTEPESTLQLPLDRLHLQWPPQPPPKITRAQAQAATAV